MGNIPDGGARERRLAYLLRLSHAAIGAIVDQVGRDGPLDHLLADIEAELPELRDRRPNAGAGQ